MNPDRLLQRHITELSEEIHALERSGAGMGPSESRRVRLRQLEIDLDRCWDLVRQRRARRRAGLDTGFATERSASIVEGYRQ